MTMAIADFGGSASGHETRTWRISLAVVLGLHLAALTALVWHRAQPMATGAEPVMMIELARAPVAPAKVEAPKPEPMPVVKPEPTPVIQKQKPAPAPRPVHHKESVQESAPQAAPEQAATTAAPATVGVAGPPSNVQATFRDLLMARLEHFKRYPEMAKRKGEQGTPYLWFAMDAQGHVLDAKLARSSGHPLLDDEVLALVHRAAPLPPIPPEMKVSRMEFTVPINFTLR